MLTPTQVLEKWIEHINGHDANAIAELYHENAENLQVAIGEPLRGKPAIHADFVDFFKNIPDTSTTVENLFADGEWAILEWMGQGTFRPTGKKFQFRGCGFFRVVHGKIIFQRGYWDKATWFGQVGLPLD